MPFTSQHPLQPYWDLAIAPVQADGLAAALELGIFELLSTPHTPAQLAEALSLHAPHTALLLELLWSMEVLERNEADDETQRYRCTAATLQYFCRDSMAFCGDAWLYRLHALRHFATQLPSYPASCATAAKRRRTPRRMASTGPPQRNSKSARSSAPSRCARPCP